jgi:SAM-dependent methyltransferase
MWLLSYNAEIAIKRTLATPFLRHLLRRPSYSLSRAKIAARYLRGNGIEVGALNQPLPLPEGARVSFVDSRPIERLHTLHGDLDFVQAPDTITDFETLRGIADEACDFVIANHVLEHLENPLQALVSTSRVLRKAGVAFIALPDKNRTFDRRRKVTPLAHVLRDLNEGPSWSRHEHYLDWAENVEGLRGPAASLRAQQLEAERAEIHFHVWDAAAMREMFACAEGVAGLHPIESQRNRGELIWVLRKA